MEMRTDFVLPVALVTPIASRRKPVRYLIGVFCSMLLFMVAINTTGCARADKPNDPPTGSGASQKATTEKNRPEAAARSACELLSASEVAGFLGVPSVKKDEVNP